MSSNLDEILIVLLYVSSVIFEKFWLFFDFLQNVKFLIRFEFLIVFLSL